MKSWIMAIVLMVAWRKVVALLGSVGLTLTGTWAVNQFGSELANMSSDAKDWVTTWNGHDYVIASLGTWLLFQSLAIARLRRQNAGILAALEDELNTTVNMPESLARRGVRLVFLPVLNQPPVETAAATRPVGNH